MEQKKILVVEDNTLNMKLARSLLLIKNYLVLEAFDAEQGIKIAREQKPDLNLMDLQLPAMDGLHATRILKNDPLLQHIPIIALTSYAMSGDKEKALKVGCNEYIAKPLERQQLLETVGRLLADHK